MLGGGKDIRPRSGRMGHGIHGTGMAMVGKIRRNSPFIAPRLKRQDRLFSKGLSDPPHGGTIMSEQEQMEHEELVRRIAKSGQEIKDSLSAKDLDLWHHATGCATEAGELLDAAKKVAIYNKPVDRENVIEELGDLEFYMQGIRANLGITREECLAHNIAKLTKRYPKGTFDNADAVARADKHGEQDH